MPPFWLSIVAKAHIFLSLIAAGWVAVDIFVVGRRQKMKIMEAVWPLTMLYFGPIGAIFYCWFGRTPSISRSEGVVRKKSMWQATFTGATHCGAGCALGDFLGDWLAFLLGFTISGSDLASKIVLGFAFAYALGILFQYFSVAPMRGLGIREGIFAAIKIDTLSLTAYEVGMFAWMAFRATVYPDLKPTNWSYWLMMQIAMIVGFITTYPVNWWLILRGIKERM